MRIVPAIEAKLYAACSEIKSQYLFEKETVALKYPDLQDGTFKSAFKLGLREYGSLVFNRSMHGYSFVVIT